MFHEILSYKPSCAVGSLAVGDVMYVFNFNTMFFGVLYFNGGIDVLHRLSSQ